MQLQEQQPYQNVLVFTFIQIIVSHVKESCLCRALTLQDISRVFQNKEVTSNRYICWTLDLQSSSSPIQYYIYSSIYQSSMVYYNNICFAVYSLTHEHYLGKYYPATHASITDFASMFNSKSKNLWKPS